MLQAAFLIPISVCVYTASGGLKATFLSSYIHTVIIYVALCIFSFTVYATGSDLGSPAKVCTPYQTPSKQLCCPLHFRLYSVCSWQHTCAQAYMCPLLNLGLPSASAASWCIPLAVIWAASVGVQHTIRPFISRPFGNQTALSADHAVAFCISPSQRMPLVVTWAAQKGAHTQSDLWSADPVVTGQF